MKYSLIIPVLLITLNSVFCEEIPSRTDSLLTALQKTDKNNYPDQFRILQQLYDLYLINNLPAALSIAQQQYSLAEKSREVTRKAEAEGWKGYIYYIQGKNDSSLIFLNNALESYKASPDKKKEALITNNIANIFRITAQYDTAMVLYTNLLKYYESEKDFTQQGKVLSNIGSLYYTAGNTEKALEYSLLSLEMQKKTGDKRGIAVTLVNLSVFALNAGNYQEGIKYGDEAITILKDIDKNYYAAALLRVGYCYYMTDKKETALDYTRTAIDIYKANNNVRGMMEAYRQQGDYLMDSERYADARKVGQDALLVADTTNRLDMRLLYDMLKRTAIWLNIPEEALLYSQKQIDMKEADLNGEWAEKIAEIDTKYNTEKKELEIATLTAQKRTQTILITSLFLLLVASAATGYFIYKNQKHRQLLSAQKIKELEQEKLISSTQALLQGEATERARLSRDLHDGLGGMLSVAKLKMATMKGNLTIPEENVPSLNSAIELLDISIKELRRVAHNLMPESLMKYGLNAALADFCHSTGKVTYHFFGEDKRAEEKTEIAMYRIINELVNNSIRHSEAENINVQLLIDDTRVHAIVEDDGKGFDASMAETDGSGLRNVRTRVSSLNGKFEMATAPGKGTEINVEFNR